MQRSRTYSLMMVALLAGMGFVAHGQQTNPPGPSQAPAAGDAQRSQRPAAADPTAAQQQADKTDIQSLAAVDAQIAAMRNIQEKLREAKTPQERQSLRAEHWRLMQQARETMHRDQMGFASGEGKMGPGKGMGPPSTGMMGGPGAPSTAGTPPMNAAQREAWNERRLDMMQAMMEMMMEYLPATPPPVTSR